MIDITGTIGADGRTALSKMNEWTHRRMTVLNHEILKRRALPSILVKELNEGPLRIAPPVESISPIAARQLMTMIGMYGSSVGRHYQEVYPALKETPSKALEELFATELALPFCEYVRRVAERTETGHQPKDAFASLVRWNVPSSRLVWEGQELASIRGYFPDSTRTYTGAEGEATFFKLLKKAETFEAAANDIFLSIVRREVPLDSGDTLERVRLAKLLLDGVRCVNLEYFAKNENGEQSLTPEHFMDVFRQFAVHWDNGDIPSSGSQDAEFLRRDLYLGIRVAGYDRHLRRMFPALLDEERDLLEEGMQLPCISSLVLEKLSLSEEECAKLSKEALLALVREHPFVLDYYMLLHANARVASSHLGLAKEFLFNPMRERASQGRSDAVVVSNWAGTTGMLEQLLESLTEGRRQHALRFLGGVPLEQLLQIASLREPRMSSEELSRKVEFLHA